MVKWATKDLDNLNWQSLHSIPSVLCLGGFPCQSEASSHWKGNTGIKKSYPTQGPCIVVEFTVNPRFLCKVPFPMEERVSICSFFPRIKSKKRYIAEGSEKCQSYWGQIFDYAPKCDLWGGVFFPFKIWLSVHSTFKSDFHKSDNSPTCF